MYEPITVEVKVKGREKGDAEGLEKKEKHGMVMQCTSFTESVQQGLLFETLKVIILSV